MRKPTFLWRSEKPLFHDAPTWARKALATAGLAYLAVCGALFAGQRSLLFQPPEQARPAPGSLMVEADGARFWVTLGSNAPGHCAPDGSGKRSAVAYFGGNAEGASRFGGKASKAFPGCTIYALSYPGYEGTPGEPSEKSIHRAADAMMAAMARDGIDLSSSLLMGRSLGSGVAARQASRGPCALAALISPYDSLANVVGSAYWWAPVSLLMLDPFDARPWAAAARCPASILYAEDDQVIPASHAFALARAWADGDSTLSSSVGSTHSNILDSDISWRNLREAWISAQAVNKKS